MNATTTPTRVLVTGATGYVGGRLVPLLVEEGFSVRVLVRSTAKVRNTAWIARVDVVEGDAIDEKSLDAALVGVDVAFYLLHSISTGAKFDDLEAAMARKFAEAASRAKVRRIVYLGGIANDENLSKHLESRRSVGKVLASTGVPVIELRAGIIIGSGSASFEMLRYLTEHLPAMVTQRRKQGFELPFDHWLRGSLREEMRESLSASTWEGRIDRQAANEIWEGFLARRLRWSRVWALDVLREWIERYLGPPRSVGEAPR